MKNILGAVGITLSNAVEYVVDKNRKAAQISRLKSVIRSEERISEKAFAALGKYYYHHLRDENDPVTEPYCTTFDHSAQRMDRAITRLEELSMEAGHEDSCDDCEECTFDCTECGHPCDSVPFDEDDLLAEEEEAEATAEPVKPAEAAPETETAETAEVSEAAEEAESIEEPKAVEENEEIEDVFPPVIPFPDEASKDSHDEIPFI